MERGFKFEFITLSADSEEKHGDENWLKFLTVNFLKYDIVSNSQANVTTVTLVPSSGKGLISSVGQLVTGIIIVYIL